MTPFTLASILTLALVPGGQAIVRFRNVADICSGKCRTDFGWPGHPFPNDPWGLVMDPKLMSSSSSFVAADPAPPTAPGGVEASPSSRSDVAFTGFPSLSSSVSSPSQAAASTPFSVSSSSNAAASTSKLSSTEDALHIFSTSSASKKPLPTPSNASSQLSPSPPPLPLSSSPPPLPSSSSSLLPSAPSSAPSSSPSASPSNTSLGMSNGSGILNANPGPSSANSGSPTSQANIQAYLSGHNAVRILHGAVPLTYSQNLAAKAQQWADGCVFTHSDGKLGAFGENIAAGTGDGYGIPQAITSWTDEASQYDAGNPQPSHFTQVVWKGTTQVGCALQNCDGIFSSSYGKAHFYVCEYSPQGNIIGEFGANVQA